MRTKLFAAASAVLLLGTIIVAAWPATAAETLRFRIAFGASEFHEIDGNGDGDSDDPTDQEVGNFVLKRGGEREGHLNFHCMQTQASPPRDLCWATIQITGKGTVTVHGSSATEGERFIGAITGGTGAYRSAEGVFKLNFGRRSTITLEID